MSADSRGLARSTDPATSHLATSHSSPTSHVLRWLILGMLDEHAPHGLYDDELVDLLGQVLGDDNFTPSGAKTRRRELVDIGLVRTVGTATNIRGRTVCRWGVTDDGRHRLATGDSAAVARLFREFRQQRDAQRSEPASSRVRSDNVVLRRVLGEVIDAYDSNDGPSLHRAISAAKTAAS